MKSWHVAVQYEEESNNKKTIYDSTKKEEHS